MVFDLIILCYFPPMKNQARNLGILVAAIITFTLTGCSTTKEVAVTEAPPPPQQETLTVPPNANYIWEAGHWARHDNQWVWENGHWMLRPSNHAVWEPGHWDQTKSGWIWREGQWRENAFP